MSEEQAKYEVEDSIENALEMMGTGYEHPSLELHPQQTVIRRRGFEMQEEVIPAFVKISTAFKGELSVINGDALKVWLFIALSINRNTGQAHPGVRTIAKACKVGVNQVTAHVKHLEELGLLAVNREDRKYNIYEMPDYVSANTVTPKVTDGKTVTRKRESVTPISDLTREPDINNDDDSAPPPNVFEYYENNIAMLTQKSREVLLQAEQDYPPSWIIEAIDLAVLHNARNWAYCEAILRRWKEKGKDAGRPERRNGRRKNEPPAPPKETPEQRAARERIAREMVKEMA